MTEKEWKGWAGSGTRGDHWENFAALDGHTKACLDFMMVLFSKWNLTIRKNHAGFNAVVTFRLGYRHLLVSVDNYSELVFIKQVKHPWLKNLKCSRIWSFLHTWCHKWEISQLPLCERSPSKHRCTESAVWNYLPALCIRWIWDRSAFSG